MDKIELIEFEEFKNQFIVKAVQGEQRLGHAIYHSFEDTLYLTWIETGEAYQGQGVGSAILDFVATKAFEANLKLAVIVIDEFTLMDFYLKWYAKRVKATPETMPQVEKKFESMIKHGESPSLLLTPQDLA